MNSTAPRRRTPRSPMWILGLVIMIDQVDQNIVRGVQDDLRTDLGISNFQIGLLLSAFVLVNGIISLPAGYLADRWNRTRTVGHTVVAWSGITALTAAAPNYASLIAVRGALGFGQAVTEPSCASLLGDYYPAAERGRAFAIQQVMSFIGFGLGIGLGGLVAEALGWRAAFLIVGTPGVLIAFFVYRMREPRRGAADRLHLGIEDDEGEDDHLKLFEHGFRRFFRDMIDGLVADFRTIWSITTMKYALIGVSTLLFTITAAGAALPGFYLHQLGVEKGAAEAYVGALVIIGGIPGILLGGRFADRYATRIRGARMAIPAFCILAGNSLFITSYIPGLPLAAVFALQVVGFTITVMSVPALRAGLSDAVPAHLRGAGFGAFNIFSVIFGQAVASLVVLSLADYFGDNFRTALIIVSPPVFIGAFILLKARDHLDADAAKIFEAIMKAMQEQQERDAADASERALEGPHDGV